MATRYGSLLKKMGVMFQNINLFLNTYLLFMFSQLKQHMRHSRLYARHLNNISKKNSNKCYLLPNVTIFDYLVNDKRHRHSGPASIQYRINGNIEIEIWCVNEKVHRINGPAIRTYDLEGNLSQELWYIDGKLHREDGPALINWLTKQICWYIYDERLLFV